MLNEILSQFSMVQEGAFCVYVTCYRGEKLPPYYIGHSSCLKIKQGYHGSVLSKRYKHIWCDELKNNPDLFVSYILSKHQTRLEAEKREGYVQQMLNVVESDLFVNQCFAGKAFFLGSKHTIETKAKIRAKASLYRHSEETKAKISKKQKGIPRQKASNETKMKMSKTRKGKKQTPEFVEKRIAPLRGKKKGTLSPEIRLKISMALTGRKAPEAECARLTLAQLKRWGFQYHIQGNGIDEVVNNLKDFCKLHNVSYSSLIACSRLGQLHKKSGFFIKRVKIL